VPGLVLTQVGPRRAYHRGMCRTAVLAVTGPPVLLAALGVSHPHHLTAGSAHWWTVLHTILLPLFPLLGVAHWVLLRHESGVLAWLGRVAALLYVALYGALDAVAGVGTGTVMQRSGAAHTAERPEIHWLFAVGNQLGGAGAWSFLGASVATSAALARRYGRGVLPGAAVLLAGSVSFLDSHIYWPRGVVTMLALAAGFGLLARVTGADLTRDHRGGGDAGIWGWRWLRTE